MKYIKEKIQEAFPTAEEITVTRDNSFTKRYIAEWSLQGGDRIATLTMNIDADDDGRIVDSVILIRERRNAWAANAADEDQIYAEDESKPLTSCLNEAKRFCQYDLGLVLDTKND